MNPLRQATRTLKHQIRQQARKATQAAGQTDRINVTGARNVVVSGTNGGDGSTDATSSRQSVHVRQRDGETVEETVSTSDVASRSNGAEDRGRTVRTTRTVQTGTGGTVDDE